MSAFMCDDCHLTALAAYAITNGLTEINDVGTVFRMLARENQASLDYRYPNDANQEVYFGKPCRRAILATPDPTAILKAAQCYAYQACEHPSWKTSAACALVIAIGKHALDHGASEHSAAYKAAAWGFDCPHPKEI